VTWIAVDESGGTVRAWIMTGPDAQLLQGLSGSGLPDLIGPHLADGSVTTVLRSGGAAGIFGPVPSHPLGAGPVPVPYADSRAAVFAVPGLSQAAPTDFTQGEETAIAGFIGQHPDWDGVLCLPGRHSRWAQVSAGEVVSFRSFLTGELFAVLAAPLQQSDSTDAVFLDALGNAISHPERIAAALFSLRAQTVLGDPEAAEARTRLSGLLIGLELAATRPYWLGQNVALIVSGDFGARYDTALRAQGIHAKIADRTQMTLAGLRLAHEMLLARRD